MNVDVWKSHQNASVCPAELIFRFFVAEPDPLVVVSLSYVGDSEMYKHLHLGQQVRAYHQRSDFTHFLQSLVLAERLC